MLSDFGLARVATASVRASSEGQGTASFMAPELLLPEKFGLDKGVPSKEADVYALGMTVYQVLTGRWPYYPRREAEVTCAVIFGERPPKPENAERIGMTEAVWNLLKECWSEDRTVRPTITEVLKKFREIIGEGKTSDSALERSAPLRLNTGNHSSVVSQSSRFDTTGVASVSTMAGRTLSTDLPGSLSHGSHGGKKKHDRGRVAWVIFRSASL